MGIWQRSRSSISSGVCRDALAAGVWFLVIQVKGYIQLDGLKSEPHNRAASASNDLVLCPPRDAHCRLVSAAALPCDFSKSVEKSAAEIWTASGGVYSICSFIVVCRFLFKCRRWHPLLAPTEASARRESQDSTSYLQNPNGMAIKRFHADRTSRSAILLPGHWFTR